MERYRRPPIVELGKLAPRLEKAWSRRQLEPDTTAFRWCNAEGDGLPAVTVDWFDGVAILSLYAAFTHRQEEQLAEALEAVAHPRAIYLKRRPVEARESVKAPPEQIAPSAPLCGEPADQVSVLENGLRYLIRPPNGLSVGLYLDARDARRWVREHSWGKTVLNCFAYTCGFGIAAIAGGATRAVNLDVSRRVLEWGEQNAALNGQPVSRRDYIAGDVFDWLVRLRKKSERFDLVVLDPPSFSTTRHSRFSAARDYSRLAQEAASLVSPGGVLLACCNLATLPSVRFRSLVLQGAERAGRVGRALPTFGASAVDYPTPDNGESPLKVLPVELK